MTLHRIWPSGLVRMTRSALAATTCPFGVTAMAGGRSIKGAGIDVTRGHSAIKGVSSKLRISGIRECMLTRALLTRASTRPVRALPL